MNLEEIEQAAEILASAVSQIREAISSLVSLLCSWFHTPLLFAKLQEKEPNPIPGLTNLGYNYLNIQIVEYLAIPIFEYYNS